jgi:hypothetical protein
MQLAFLTGTVDQEADRAEQQVRHADHQVNALVIRARLAHRIVIFLRTGGGNGLLSGRAGAGRARQTKDGEKRQRRND